MAYVTDYMRVSEVDTKGCSRVDAGIHASYCVDGQVWCHLQQWAWGENYLRTRYFFAGGRTRSPCVKDSAYFSFEEMRFFWIDETIALGGM